MHSLVVTRRVVARSPATWSGVFACLLGGIAAGGAMVGVAAMTGFLGLVWVASGSQWMQRCIADELRLRDIRERRMRRDQRLDEAGVPRDVLAEATALADAVALTDARLAEHLELDALLDHYVDVAIALARCRAVLSSATPAQLSRRKKTGDACGIAERRVALWKRCRERADALEDELASVIELLRLVVDQTSLGEQVDLDDGALVADRLALLDGARDAVAELDAAG